MPFLHEKLPLNLVKSGQLLALMLHRFLHYLDFRFSMTSSNLPDPDIFTFDRTRKQQEVHVSAAQWRHFRLLQRGQLAVAPRRAESGAETQVRAEDITRAVGLPAGGESGLGLRGSVSDGSARV